jgi:hypothetical protein
LKNLPEYPKKSLWSEILFWEISQCREDIAFDCVTSKDTLEKNNKAQIEVTWDYDSYGSPANSKSTFLEMDTNMINNYEFIVPPGGTNLTRLTIRYISFPGTLEIYSLRLSYII